MERIFYFFVKTLEGEVKDLPIYSDEFLGDIKDVIEFNGVKYIIIDYVVDYMNYDEVM